MLATFLFKNLEQFGEFLRVSNVDNLVAEHFPNLYQTEVSVTSRRKAYFVHITTVAT